MNLLEKHLKSAGIYQYGIINTKDIIFSNDVRHMCEVNTCRKYNTTWACPPALGTVEECRQRICKYEKMLVITGKYLLKDSFDFEGMMENAKIFSSSCRIFDTSASRCLSDYLMFSNEGCDICEECTYPNAPCRFPNRMHGSLEGNGIFVGELAKLAGVAYNNGPDTVTYFGALVCRKNELDKYLSAPASDK